MYKILDNGQVMQLEQLKNHQRWIAIGNTPRYVVTGNTITSEVFENGLFATDTDNNDTIDVIVDGVVGQHTFTNGIMTTTATQSIQIGSQTWEIE